MMDAEAKEKNSIVKEITIGSLFIVLIVITNHMIAKGFIPLTWICNPGIAFGIKLPEPLFLIMWAFTMLFVIFLWLETYKRKNEKELTKRRVKIYRFALLLIICGAVANIIDRALHGCVIDYIALVPWNRFNIADASIFIGVVLILWDAFFPRSKQK